MFSKLNRRFGGVVFFLSSVVLLLATQSDCANILGADFDVRTNDGGGLTSATSSSSGGTSGSPGACGGTRKDCNGLAADGCEVDIAASPDHCGECKHACTTGQVCADSRCTDSCPGNTKECDRACIDTTTSNAHCGKCNSPCLGTTQSCLGGKCEQCPGNPCKLTFPQCGCETGSGCYLNSSNLPVCLPAGKGAEAAVCSTDVDCEPGHLCSTLSGTNVRVCKRICESAGDCSGPGSHCRQTERAPKLCSIPCEPVKNTKCPTNTGCQLRQETNGERYTECGQVGVLQQQAPCDDTVASKNCAPGYNCSNDPQSGGFICIHYCRQGVAGDCPATTTCNINDFANKIGSAVYGACFQ